VAEALHALVRTRLAGGAAAPNPFQGVYVDPTDVERLLARPMVGVGDGDRRGQGGQDEQAPFALPPELAASPLGRVRDGLGLSLFETAVILLCLLPELDPRYASLFGFLHDDLTRKLPSVELALALFAPRGPDGLEYLRAFTPGAALRAWQLAHMPQDDTLIRQPLALDRALVWYLLGDAGPDASLGRAARVVPGSRELGEALPTTLAALDAAAGGPPLALLYGEDEHTCLGEAIAAAAALNRPLLLVDGTLLAEQETGVETLRRCLREAVLHGLLPCVTGAARLLRPASARAGVQRVPCGLPGAPHTHRRERRRGRDRRGHPGRRARARCLGPDRLVGRGDSGAAHRRRRGDLAGPGRNDGSLGHGDRRCRRRGRAHGPRRERGARRRASATGGPRRPAAAGCLAAAHRAALRLG